MENAGLADFGHRLLPRRKVRNREARTGESSWARIASQLLMSE
jgi:hypothetical protein